MRWIVLVLVALAAAAPVLGAEEPAETPPAAEADAPAKEPTRNELLARTQLWLSGRTAPEPSMLRSFECTHYTQGKKSGGLTAVYTEVEIDGQKLYAADVRLNIATADTQIAVRYDIRMNPAFRPTYMKVAREKKVGEEKEVLTFQLTFEEKITIRRSDRKETMLLDPPEALLGDIASLFLVAQALGAGKPLHYLFSVIELEGGKVVELDTRSDGKKIKRMGPDGVEKELFAINFNDVKGKSNLRVFLDDKGLPVGLDMPGMSFFLGKPAQMPDLLPGKAPAAAPVIGKAQQSPKIVVLACFRGIYAADRELLEGIFDFKELYRLALGEAEPSAKNLARFREGVLKTLLGKKDPQALAKLPQVAEKLVEEIEGDTARILLDGRVVARLRSSQGSWRIIWIQP
jgi:hypothetical protein